MVEPERFRQEAIQNWRDVPYMLIIKKYGVRWCALALAWFIYDFITYPFGIYSSTILDVVIKDNALTTIFGWNVVINLFYIPGTMLGAFLVDWVKPKRLMCIMLVCQAIVGFAMSGAYVTLTQHIAGFTVLYGIFLSFGEAGPGNCLGLLASKSSPTAFRGKFYGLAAAAGKIGAFVGTWSFPAIEKDFGSGNKGITGPFYVASGLALVSALVTFFFLPEINADHMLSADAEFREYLLANGYDVTKIGLRGESSLEHALAPGTKAGLELEKDPKMGVAAVEAKEADEA